MDHEPAHAGNSPRPADATAIPRPNPAVDALPSVTLAARARGLRSSAIRDLLSHVRRPGMISFAGGLPAADGFDAEGLREAFAVAMAEPGHALQYGETEGEPALREQLAALMAARGTPAPAARILVTTGSQQGLDLLARLLLDPGDTVAFARPTYLAALSVFQLAQARLLGLPCDEDGPLPEALEAAAVRGPVPKLLYLVPEFANPTGETIGLARRRALLAVAARHGIVVAEDDPYGALRFTGETVPSLLALSAQAPGATVVHLSTLSKILAPALRIGWMVLPDVLFGPAVRIKQALDLHSSTLCQLAAARYLASGRLADRLPRLRTMAGERQHALSEALERHLGGALRTNRPQGGMFLWARLADDARVDTADWLRHALAHDVMFVPGGVFYDARPDTATLRLSFATTAPGRMDEGAARLAAALGECRRSSAH